MSGKATKEKIEERAAWVCKEDPETKIVRPRGRWWDKGAPESVLFWYSLKTEGLAIA